MLFTAVMCFFLFFDGYSYSLYFSYSFYMLILYFSLLRNSSVLLDLLSLPGFIGYPLLIPYLYIDTLSSCKGNRLHLLDRRCRFVGIGCWAVCLARFLGRGGWMDP